MVEDWGDILGEDVVYVVFEVWVVDQVVVFEKCECQE